MNTPEHQPPASDDDDAEPLLIGAGIDFSDPNSPLAFLYLRTSGVVAVAFLVLVFIFFGVATQLSPTDIWGHLKYGEWIVQTHQLPQRELFSQFSDPDVPYWNFQWLAQVIFYLTYHAGELMAGGDEVRQTAGGVEMLRSLHGLLIALKAMFVLLAIRRATGSMSLAIAGCALQVFLTLPPNRIERPQIFGEVFFAFLLWWLSGPRLPRRTLLVLPMMFALWANCHGSFPVGLVLLGAICLGRVVESSVSLRDGFTQPWWKNSWFVLGTLTLALTLLAVTFLNPHGPRIFSGIFALARHPNIRTIVEWEPLDFNLSIGPHWLYLASVILLAVSQAVCPRPLALSRVLVLIPFAVGPLYQQRMIVWWMIVLPWMLAELWRHTGATIRHILPHFRTVPSLRKTLMAVLIAMVGFSWSGFFQLLIGRDPLALQSSTAHATLWPLAFQLKHGAGMPALQDALKDYPQQRFKGRIFAQDLLADYLLWTLPDTTPVFVYNHAHVFPESIWQQQINVLNGGPGWESILVRHKVNLVAVDSDMCGILAAKLRRDPEWQIVLDEGRAGTGSATPDIYNARLLIAVRKRPITD